MDMQQPTQEPGMPVLSVPPKRVSAWVAETTVEGTRAWLEELPLTDSAQVAQWLYQALFTLNRMELPHGERMTLMELYRAPVSAAVDGLQGNFTYLSLPLRPRQKQLADFLCQLNMEMAYGYKRVVLVGLRQRKHWEDESFLTAVERSIHYLGEVLLRAYQVYMPFPPGVWKEIHSLYRYAEQHACENAPLADHTSIAHCYRQVLMLGLCGPYQLLQNESVQVNAFLARWADKAVIDSRVQGVDPVGRFLVDFDTDHPAVPLPHDVPLRNAPSMRVVNAIELARTAHDFVVRLQKGESPQALELGFDCVDTACVDTLKRMLRFWGLAGRRHFSRRRLQQPLSLCVGLHAIHFFVDGQRPFVSPHKPVIVRERAVEAPDRSMLEAEANAAPVTHGVPGEVFRVDSKWQVRDESAGGLSLARSGEASLPIHIGDVLGIHNPTLNQWRIGVVRWVKSPDPQNVEMGVEMLAPSAQALAVRPLGRISEPYNQALLLPSIAALHQPATLIVPCGSYLPGQDIEIAEAELPPRIVRIFNVVERTNSFTQIVFADVAREEKNLVSAASP
jgi:hypothetical protein